MAPAAQSRDQRARAPIWTCRRSSLRRLRLRRLSDEERDLGVALVELGAGVTNVSLHIGGMLVGLRSIPIGAADITDDIASAFGIRRSQAERMKCFYGSAMQSRRDFRRSSRLRRPPAAPSRPRRAA